MTDAAADHADCLRGLLSVEMGVTRVATIGVALIAFLTGFGAVNAIYSNLSFFLAYGAS